MKLPEMFFFTSCLLISSFTLTACQNERTLPITFLNSTLKAFLGDTVEVAFNSSDCSIFDHNLTLRILKGNDVISADVKHLPIMGNSTSCWSAFNATATMIGSASLVISSDTMNSTELEIIVVRKKRVIDKIFIYSVITLVSLIYVNFGCALDWNIVLKTIRRPIGPSIGIFCQCLFMPLISFSVGKFLFPDHPEMELGLFFTGVSPAGGASNVWSVALEANVNLSVTMTTISTILAFATIPFWLFTLGYQIFIEAKLETPYTKILSYVLSLVVPLLIGFFFQKQFPRFSKFMVRILKPFSIFLILFIIIFACITNSFLFKLFTWKIVVAGICLPWLGYVFGFAAAKAMKQPIEDVLAIAVETGVQNSGIAIFMLGVALPDPISDIATVIPVAVSIMTPIPLMILCACIKIKRRRYDNIEVLSDSSNIIES